MPKTRAQPDLSHIASQAVLDDQVTAQLQTTVPKDASYEALVDACQEMVTEKDEHDRLDAEAKQHKDRYEELRKQVIPNLMQALGLVRNNKGQFNFPSGKIHLETKVYASCSGDNNEKFQRWLIAEGHQDMIKTVVNAQTLSAFVRERRESNLPDPPFVATHEETVAKLTKR